MTTPSVWRSRDFRFLFAGRVVDMVGNAAAPVALAFAVLDLTGSVADLGLVVAARTVGNIVLVLVGGVLADRWRRSTVLVASNVLSAAVQAVVAVSVLTGTATVGSLVALSAVGGAAGAASMPAAAALVPQTVPDPLLSRANALTRLGVNGAAIGGASLGGLLVAAVGPGWGLGLDAASFLVAGALYGAVRVGASSRATESTSILADLRDGWRAVVSRRWMWLVVLAFMVVNAVLGGAVHVVGPLVADATVGRAGWGVVLGALTAGMAGGALLALRLAPRHPLRVGMLCSAAIGALPLALAVAPVLPVLLVVALVCGVCMETFAIAWDTALQRHVPSTQLARVYAYDLLGSFVAIPAGQVVAGPLADAVGTDPVLVGAAGLIAVAAVVALFDPAVRRLPSTPCEPPDPQPAEPRTLLAIPPTR